MMRPTGFSSNYCDEMLLIWPAYALRIPNIAAPALYSSFDKAAIYAWDCKAELRVSGCAILDRRGLIMRFLNVVVAI